MQGFSSGTRDELPGWLPSREIPRGKSVPAYPGPARALSFIRNSGSRVLFSYNDWGIFEGEAQPFWRRAMFGGRAL
eukprot:3288000-Rhodomonas_salina.3